MTYEEEMSLVEAAIAKALRGQSYSINGRSVQRPDLRALYDRLDFLRSAIAAESGGIASLAQIDKAI